MIVTIPKLDLLRAVARCQSVADKRSATPVLACLLVEVAEGAAAVSATDLYVSVRVVAPCEHDADGSFAVDAKDLGERLKHMPDGIVRLTYEKDRCVLSAVGSPRKFTLPAHHGADFPKVAVTIEDGEAKPLTIQADALAATIGRVIYAVSLDETRPHVNCGLLEWGPNSLAIVATDGHRLSRAEVAAEYVGAPAMALVPLRALHEIRNLCGSGGGIALRVSGSSIYVETSSAMFSAKLVDAQFPPYAQVIPESNEKRRVTLPRAGAVSAIEAVMVAAKDNHGGMMKLDLGKGSARFSAESSKSGDASDDVPAECAIKATIGVNGRYLLDVFCVINDDEIRLEPGGELDPIRIDAPGLVAVVMPTRL